MTLFSEAWREGKLPHADIHHSSCLPSRRKSSHKSLRGNVRTLESKALYTVKWQLPRPHGKTNPILVQTTCNHTTPGRPHLIDSSLQAVGRQGGTSSTGHLYLAGGPFFGTKPPYICSLRLATQYLGLALSSI